MKIKKFIKQLYIKSGTRYIFRNYLLYNRLILIILTKINSFRWRSIKLYVVIWPPAITFFEEIINDLSLQCNVLSFEKFVINKKNFHNFLCCLYTIDNASQNKILTKVNRLQVNANLMGLVLIEIKKPKMIANDIFNYVKCTQVNSIKKGIRLKYKDKIENYIYDIIIHSTEVDYQNKKVEDLILKYK